MCNFLLMHSTYSYLSAHSPPTSGSRVLQPRDSEWVSEYRHNYIASQGLEATRIVNLYSSQVITGCWLSKWNISANTSVRNFIFRFSEKQSSKEQLHVMEFALTTTTRYTIFWKLFIWITNTRYIKKPFTKKIEKNKKNIPEFQDLMYNSCVPAKELHFLQHRNEANWHSYKRSTIPVITIINVN